MLSKEKSLYALTNALQPVLRVWKLSATLAIAKSGISMSLATVVVWVYRNPQGINQRDLTNKIETSADKLRVEIMHDIPLADIESATRILRLFEERAGQYTCNRSAVSHENR